MNCQIVVESKAWNRADLFDGQINVLWEREIDFDIIEYQIRDESDKIVLRSEYEEDVKEWLNDHEESIISEKATDVFSERIGGM